jgi:spoIIIJ-associated protein
MEKTQSHKKTLGKILDEILGLIGIDATLDIVDDEKNNAILVNMESPEQTGLIIGTRGETINSLQSIVGIILKNKTGQWKRVVLNVGDWREKQNEKLTQLALQAAERAKSTGQPQHLNNLTPSQRRTVHMFLSEDEEVVTESTGENKERYLIVSKKN